MDDGLPDGWVVETCGDGDGDDSWLLFPPDVRDRAASMAILFMWAATGRRYGLSGLTVQPSRQRPPEPLYQVFPVAAGHYDGYAGGGGYGSCSGGCEVELPGPVADIVQVRIDGFAIEQVYEVRDGHLLARTDGQCWPTCQGSDVSSGSVPVLEVDYHRGLRVPPAVQFATEKLACEYGQMFTGGTCRLPGQMRSLSRQGVDLEMASGDGETSSGRLLMPGRIRTTIKEIDDVLDAVNPYGQVEPREVVSPDDPPTRTVTWPPKDDGWWDG